MKALSLPKSTRLCLQAQLESLFQQNLAQRHSALIYPLRAVWIKASRPQGAQFIITVPKKRLRHAVDRVAARRRIREAFRLNFRDILPADASLSSGTKAADIAFLYVADEVVPSAQIHSAMRRLLRKIAATL